MYLIPYMFLEKHTLGTRRPSSWQLHGTYPDPQALSPYEDINKDNEDEYADSNTPRS